MIQDLTEMMVERLQAYKAASKNLPKRVIVYRDGVSEVRVLGPLRLTDVLRQNRRGNTRKCSKKSSLSK